MKIKKIGLLTSGGDVPGLNACIRAIVRAAHYHNISVVGIQHGYDGLIIGDFIEMNAVSVSNIIHRGGTILKTSRSKKFLTEEGRKAAWEKVKEGGLEALIIIGGDGSLKGAAVFSAQFDIPVIGIPKTIDNDINGTDFAIGFDTAVNTAMEAIDKIRDTAESHDRLYFVEVMGRDAGYIAAYTGVSVGAEAILIPESMYDNNYLLKILEKGWRRKKTSMIVVVAEGDQSGGAQKAAAKAKECFPAYDTKVCALGHIQRGGSPTCADRLLASKLGVAAVESLLAGKKNFMVGIIDKQIVLTPLENAAKKKLQADPYLFKLMETLST
jgi:6-phosphofructokinase 1